MKPALPKLILLLSALSCVSLPAKAEDPTPETAFREALYAEEVKGDPTAALETYTQLLVQLEARRDLHATALFRQAECLRKLGKKAEATAGYQKVQRLYPDIERYQKECQQALAGLGGSPAAPATSESASTPDDWAARVAEIEKLLAESPDRLNQKENNLLVTAASKGDLRMVEFLLEKGAKPTIHGISQQPLTSAAAAGHKAICEKLIEKGTGLNANNGEALLEALKANNLQILQLLCDKGADVNLLTYVTNPTGGNYVMGSFLLEATITGSLESMSILLKAKADPNLPAAYQPLKTALLKDDPKRIQLLIDSGADARLTDDAGNTCIHQLSSTGQSSNLELLTKAGVDINAKNKAGQTALHLARENVVQSLIKLGAKVNEQDKAGNTPLHLLNHSTELLLQNKVDTTIKNTDGATPLDQILHRTNRRQVSTEEVNWISQKFGDLLQVSGLTSKMPIAETLADTDNFNYLKRLFESAENKEAFMKYCQKYLDSKKAERPNCIWLSMGVAKGVWGPYLAFAKVVPKSTQGPQGPTESSPPTLVEFIANCMEGQPQSWRYSHVYNQILIHRLNADGKETETTINLNEIIAAQATKADFKLQFGDIISLEPSDTDNTNGYNRMMSEIAEYMGKRNAKSNATAQASNPAPAPNNPKDLPYGTPVIGRKGFVYSPYAPDKGMVDVTHLARGAKVECPHTLKHFRVP